MPLVLLDPYLEAPDFRAALRGLAATLRGTLDLPDDLDELGVVCVDVEQAAERIEALGGGPFLLAAGAPVSFAEDGAPRQFHTRVGFGFYQGVLIELAEPGTGSEIFASRFDPKGGIAIHHLGYFARGNRHRIGAVRFAERLARLGYARPKWTAHVFGGITVDVSLYDTSNADGLCLEFLDFRLGGVPIAYPKRAADLVARLRKKHPPRVLNLPGPSDEPLKLRWAFRASRVVPGSPRELWPWVTDSERMSRWLGPVAGDPVAVGVQRRYRLELQDGQTAEIVERYDQVHEPGRVASTGVPSVLFSQSASAFTLAAVPGGTELVWEMTFVPEATFHGLELAEEGDDWMEDSLERLLAALGVPVAKVTPSPARPTGTDYVWGLISGLQLGAGVGGHALRLVTLHHEPLGFRQVVATGALIIYGAAFGLTLRRHRAGLWIALIGPFVGVAAVVTVMSEPPDAFQVVLGIPQLIAQVLAAWLLWRWRRGVVA